MILGILPNLSKTNADVAVHALIQELEELGANYYIETSAAVVLGISRNRMTEDEVFRNCDILIAVGGDGTIIHVAKRAAVYGKPVLGINAGRVGYMACLEVSELSLIRRLFTGVYTVERRLMLEAVTSRDSNKRYFCLNEVEVSKSSLSNVLDLSIDNGDDTFMSFRADGVLLATPTGSTAYAMSAGGPVTDPTLDCMILVPICSMSMYARGFVLSPESDIRILVADGEETQAIVKFDGTNPIILDPGEVVTVRKACDMVTQLIKIKGDSFYSILKHKRNNL